MKKIISIIIGIVVILGIILAISKGNAPRSDRSIKIAALLSLTGDAATWGQNAQRGIGLAIDEINQRGGINGKQIDVLYEDTAADPKKAVSAYQLVTSVEHVTAVIGPLQQTEDTAVMPIIAETKTPTIVPGYIPLQNRSDLSNPLLVWMDAQNEAGRIAQYVFERGIRKVGVIGTQDSWEMTVSNAFIEKFTSLGGTISDKEIIQPDSADAKLPITKIISSKPEAIFLGTYYQFVNSTKVLRDLRYAGKSFSIEVDDYLAGETAGWVDDLQFIAPDYYNDAFVNKFKAKYDAAPGLPAGQSYDATNILISFLQKSEKQSEILQQMKNFKSYEGVSGKLQVGADGRTTLPMALFELKKGKVTRVESLE